MYKRQTLWWREIVRFYRQKSRVVGVLASPLVFWVVIGSGFGTSFRSGRGQGQQNYLDYFYPGALIMIVLFTSIFTMMSVIEDRKDVYKRQGPESNGRSERDQDSGPELQGRRRIGLGNRAIFCCPHSEVVW